MPDYQDLDESVLGKIHKIGGDKLVGDLIDIFLEHVPKKIQEAFQEEQDGDLEAVEKAAHSIKSSAGNMGTIALYQLAAQIEQAAATKQGTTIPPLLQDLDKAMIRIQPRLNELRKGVQT